MYHVSAQGIDEHMINIHYCYYYYYLIKLSFKPLAEVTVLKMSTTLVWIVVLFK